MTGIDFSELEEFDRKVIELAKVKYPREVKKFMQRAGNALKKDIKAAYKAETQKKTGNLLRGVSRGRAYLYQGNEYQVRVKNTAPHAHLIEHGHRLFFHHKGFTDAKYTGGWVKGKGTVGNIVLGYESKFTAQAEDFVKYFLEAGFS